MCRLQKFSYQAVWRLWLVDLLELVVNKDFKNFLMVSFVRH